MKINRKTFNGYIKWFTELGITFEELYELFESDLNDLFTEKIQTEKQRYEWINRRQLLRSSPDSTLIPVEGLDFGENIKILKGDVYELEKLDLKNYDFDLVVAGELIEHLPNTLLFLKTIKREFAGKRLICSTPNATSLSNMALSFLKRESCHIDHYQVYSYKTLNTICQTAGFKQWEIIPYYVKYTEMIMGAKGLKKYAVRFAEKTINLMEYHFPLTAGGYIIHIEI